MAKRYDIVVPKKYTKDGEEKTAWKNVGTLVRFPATEEKEEGYIMELNMYPDVTFKVFEQKPKEDRPQQKQEPKEDFPDESPKETTVDDIPW